MALWLVYSTPDQAVLVRALAGDIVLCFWTRHFTLKLPVSTQVEGNPAIDSHQEGGGGGVEILLVAVCYRNRDTLQPDGPLGLYVDLTYLQNRLTVCK